MIPLHLYPLGWAQNHLYYFPSDRAFPLYQLTITVSDATPAEDNYKLLSFPNVQVHKWMLIPSDSKRLFYKKKGMHIDLIDDKLEAYDEKLPLSFNHSLTINEN